jgi:beta-fructofuranosidase
LIEHGSTFYFFYTALSNAESPSAVQRIGLATSTDLRTWTRHTGNPIVTADPRWYEQTDQHPRGDVACRDPFVIWDDARNEWLMVYCARANSGESDARGVVGAARSRDLLHWEALPPLETPREFGQLEVPQLVSLESRWYLVFCTFDHSAARLARTGPSGHWCGAGYLVADDLHGAYRLIDDHPLDREPHAVWYAGRIETGLTGAPLFFAWLREDADGQFGGTLSNPALVSIAPDGHLSIDVTALHSQ